MCEFVNSLANSLARVGSSLKLIEDWFTIGSTLLMLKNREDEGN